MVCTKSGWGGPKSHFAGTQRADQRGTARVDQRVLLGLG
jgi:hypothetical protein